MRPLWIHLTFAATTAAGHIHGGGGGISSGALALAVLGGVLLILCIAWALARAYAWEPRWALSLRHAIAEARFRASAMWSELGDWARLGR